jgi:hypothetical protein
LVNPTYRYTIFDTICLGSTCDTLDFTVTPTVAGPFIDSVNIPTDQYGCDSIIILHLTVHPTYRYIREAERCLGDPYIDYDFNTIPQTSGLFIDSINIPTDQYGCDSIIILNLMVHPTYRYVREAERCLGERYTDDDFDSIPQASGLFIDSINIPTVQYGCDSIIILNLMVHPKYHNTIKDTICLGDRYYNSYYGFDVTPTHHGFMTYSNTHQTQAGCDSIITLHLTVHPSYYDTIDASICIDEYYYENGFDIAPSQQGYYTYTHNNLTVNGCDSVTVLQLAVNQTYSEYVSARIYEDEFYKVGNYQYNTPGLHISNLETQEGCDSIITLNLDVIYYPYETAFSPFNKDGVNDYFMPGFKIQILNRYGALIFETKTVDQQILGWDGKNSKGQDVEPGIYFYILYNSSGKPRLKSSVEVLKR